MGIESTVTITRNNAIERIHTVSQLIQDKEYRKLQKNSYETGHDIQKFIDTFELLDLTHIEKWTDAMLTDVMDRPFFRFTLFENYMIEFED